MILYLIALHNIMDPQSHTVATDEPSPKSATEDRHGARASRIITPGARAGYNSRHERESRGRCVHREELRPCSAAEGELIMERGLCHIEEERAPVPEFHGMRIPGGGSNVRIMDYFAFVFPPTCSPVT